MAKYKSGRYFFPGVISSIDYEQSKLSIHFDDGDVDEEVPLKYTRRMTQDEVSRLGCDGSRKRSVPVETISEDIPEHR